MLRLTILGIFAIFCLILVKKRAVRKGLESSDGSSRAGAYILSGSLAPLESDDAIYLNGASYETRVCRALM